MKLTKSAHDGLKSKLWIERYRDVSEFELIADVETDMRKPCCP